MLAKRIIPCLDVKDGVVVKGVKFRNHVVLGGILELAQKYRDQGADELVFYDITASAEGRSVCRDWIRDTARKLDIPFCVAGGIKTVQDAKEILNAGADKISINTPALNRPELITEIAEEFGVQCVVVGVDSMEKNGDYYTWKYTGSETAAKESGIRTMDWIQEAQAKGAGEIVLNCMNADGTRDGYDIKQLQIAREHLSIPLIASGGAGSMAHFKQAFEQAHVDGALAAGVFHRGEMTVPDLKNYLKEQGIAVRGHI